MCGILIYNKDYSPLYNIKHRGEQHTEKKLNNFIFNHSSLPLQTNGLNISQPIEFKNGDLLLFNGEIFNYKEFSNASSDLHYLKDFFRKGYKDSLIKQINKWDGFWSIVYYDKMHNCFYLFTDPLGKKQLYYSDKGISSEIKPLIEDNQSYYYSGFYYGTHGTMFSNIYRILPNKIYKINGENLLQTKTINDYYKFNRKENVDFEKLMDKSIKRRLINKMDKITLLVSGGLDSTIILFHLLKHLDKNQIQFLTIENKEDQYIKIVEDYFKIKCERIKLDNQKIKKEIKVICKSYEINVDYGSLIPQWYLVLNAKNKVILTGDGADELFSGYDRSNYKDTQHYDVFMELPYLHHIRLDRISMQFTKEIRNPFLSKEIIEFALSLSYKKRKNKKYLKEIYKNKIPIEIIERKKMPLRYLKEKQKNERLIQKYHFKVFNKFSKKRTIN